MAENKPVPNTSQNSVAKTQGRQAFEIVAASRDVAMATNPGRDRGPSVQARDTESLREAALEEAQRVINATDMKELEADKVGWTLIELMLRVYETFVQPETGEENTAALEAFLSSHGAKPHGNVKNSMQRLAKVCFPKATPRDRLSKYGSALAALRKRNVSSSQVRDELEKKEEIGKGGSARTGIYRLMLLNKHDLKAERQAEVRPKPANRYKEMPESSLKKEALLLLQALKEKLGIKTDEIEAFLAREMQN